MSCIIPENLPKVSPSPFIRSKSLFGFKGGFTGEKKDKRGYRICYTEGKRTSCARGATPEKKPKAQGEPAKKGKKGSSKISVDEVFNEVNSLLAKGGKITPEVTEQMASGLMSMTVVGLKELAKKFGQKVSGLKADLAKKILDGVLGKQKEAEDNTIDLDTLENLDEKKPEKLESMPKANEVIDPKAPVTGDSIADRLSRDKASKQILDKLSSNAAVNKAIELDNKSRELRSRVEKVEQSWFFPGIRSALMRMTSDYSKVNEVYKQANEAVRNELMDLLSNNDNYKIGVRTKVAKKSESTVLSPDMKEKSDKATEFLSKLFTQIDPNEEIENPRIKVQSGIRANYNPGDQSVNMSPNDDTGTIVHEISHHLEDQIPGVKEAIHEFIKHRCGDEEPQSLAKLFPGHGYGPNEKGRKDNFDLAFGNNAHAYYAGKVYERGSTEILSMGVEQLWNDPVRLIKKDPEFAQFLIGVLSGRVRGKSKEIKKGTGGRSVRKGTVGRMN